MARTVPLWGATQVDKIVKAWMEKNGIDPDLVSEYRIIRPAGHLTEIQLMMYFNDSAESESVQEGN